MTSKIKELVFGIDLGTTTTVISVYDQTTKQYFTIDINGIDYMPSVVGYEIIDGKPVATKVGIDAINNAPANPTNTLFNTKRFFALGASDIAKNVQPGLGNRILTQKSLDDTAAKSYKPIIKDGKVMIELEGPNHTKAYITSVDVAVAILQACKKHILKHFNIENEKDVKMSAVITVPAYFNNHQREEVKHAGELAGYNVLRIINEPTAAALSRSDQLAHVKNLIVVDLGGGTFDVSVLHTEKEGDATTMEVKFTEGHLALGGSDFDNAIIDWVISEMSKMGLKDQAGNDINVKNNKESMARLAEVAEKTKKILSNNEQAVINLSMIDYKISASKTLILTRNKFNDLIGPKLKEIKDIVQYVLDQAKMDKNDMVMLTTGGSTRVPAVQELLKSFGIKLLSGHRPDSDVSNGAAKLASGLVQGGSDVLLIDVTPLSLGIETVGGVVAKIVNKNTPIPTKATQSFSTAEDNQTTVSIHILQGERTEAQHNRSLGRFDLSGIPPAPRGVPVIEVTFELDANGIVNVSAKEKNTGKEAKITIQGKISDEERKTMEESAAANAAYDEKVLKNSQLRNTADNKVYEARKILKEHESKLDDAIKSEVSTAADALEEALRQSTDIANLNYEDLNSKSEALSSSMMKIYEKMNASAQQSEQPNASSEEGTKA